MKVTTLQRFLIIFAVGFIAIAATIWRMYPRIAKVSPTEVRFTYCATCNKEWPFDHKQKELKDPCPLCANKRMTPLKESLKKSGGAVPSPYGKMFTFVFAEVVAMMAVALLVSRPQFRTKEEDYIYMLCPHCNQKLRYVEKQIGKPGACRRCKRAFVFPELEVSRR